MNEKVLWLKDVNNVLILGSHAINFMDMFLNPISLCIVHGVPRSYVAYVNKHHE